MMRATAIALFEDHMRSCKLDPDINTEERVIAAMQKYDEPWWEETKPSAMIGEMQLNEPVLLLSSFDLFHRSIELFMGRAVLAHELANPEALKKEAASGKRLALRDIIEKIPEVKRVIVAEI